MILDIDRYTGRASVILGVVMIPHTRHANPHTNKCEFRV